MITVTISVQTSDKTIGAVVEQLMNAAGRLSDLKAKYPGDLPVPAEVAEMEKVGDRTLKTRILIEKLPE